MDKIVENLKQYIQETLKIEVEICYWKEQENLPYFLIDTYFFCKISLLGQPCLLIISRIDDITPGKIRKHCEQIEKEWKNPIIFVQSVLSSYNRKRLIEQHIPFIIPGNQMFLPYLGIDLREYFRKIVSKKSKAFSPSTQTVVLYALLREDEEKLTPSILAEKLGYTLMTMTRAFQELEAEEIGECHREGRERFWTFPDKNALWDKVKPFLRSPIRRRIWLKTESSFTIMAGLSALSHFSMLASPPLPVYALDAAQWDAFDHADIEEIPTSEGASLELEIWNYDPKLFAKKGFIDLISLYLSLEVSGDERIEIALEEVMEKINDKWTRPV